MKTSKKFTFKTVKPVGRYRSFDKPEYQIKLNKQYVGNIGMIGDFPSYYIRLMVIKDDLFEDENPNCPWKWITFKHEFYSVQAAKSWLNDNRDRIFKKYRIKGL